MVHLLAGLGNPGEKYVRHRHNIGFMLVDAVAERYGFPSFSAKHHGLISKGRVGEHPLLLLKPATYMNKSGISVAEVVRYYNIPLEHLWVAHDDLDLETGIVRTRRGGGHGGHNGLRDIDRHLGKDYGRIRFGIGHPGSKEQVHHHVLSDFSRAEWERQAPVIEAVSEYLHYLLEGNPEKLTNQLAISLKKG